MKISFLENRRARRWKQFMLQYLEDTVHPERNSVLTIPLAFDQVVAAFGTSSCLMEKRAGAYHRISFRDVQQEARAFAAFLLEHHVTPDSRVALFCKNSPAWVIADLGTMMAGAVTVPIYTTSCPKDIHAILENSQASILIVDDMSRLEGLDRFPEQYPWLQLILVLHPGSQPLFGHYRDWNEALAQGRKALAQEQGALDTIARTRRLDDLASIVYTSGTTGMPKGVLLTHRNLLSNARGVITIMEVDHTDLILSLLPLSHVFERTCGYYYTLLVGTSIAYAEGIVGFDRNLIETKPTRLCTVPLFLERLHKRILDRQQQASRGNRLVFRAAIAIGERVNRYRTREARKTPDYPAQRNPNGIFERRMTPLWKAPHLLLANALADALVYRKVRARFGGRLRSIITGGAHLAPEIHRFLQNLGLEIYEGYGLTETSPVISVNCPRYGVIGSTGKVLDHIDIDFSPEGEILVRGPSISKGYYRNPEATSEAFDQAGWFRTGDLGRLDEHHFLWITGRIKELIVLCTGKKVAPLALERLLHQHPLVSRAVVLGNDRDFISALLFPNLTTLAELAQTHQIPSDDLEHVATHPEVIGVFSQLIKNVNANFSNHEQIRHFRVIPQDILQNRELVTPTLKIKRHVVETVFGKTIDEIYL